MFGQSLILLYFCYGRKRNNKPQWLTSWYFQPPEHETSDDSDVEDEEVDDEVESSDEKEIASDSGLLCFSCHYPHGVDFLKSYMLFKFF